MEPQLNTTHIFKRKRTNRPRSASPLHLTMAASSVSYSSGTATAASGLSSNSFEIDTNSTELPTATQVEQDMANCLILLAQGQTHPKLTHNPFQCKTCNRCFSSFQALGGHRASHRKPKIIIAQEKKPPTAIDDCDSKIINQLTTSNTTLSLRIPTSTTTPFGGIIATKSKVHECSICGAEFSSGQALGGHMRRHRVVPVGTSTSSDVESKKQRSTLLSLDLNLPAPEDDCRESKFQFVSTKEQVIVFSASPLVDCHY